jgi:hypothetical protein
MITGQTPAKHLLHQWPLVLTNISNVCFDFDAVEELEFKDDILFRVSGTYYEYVSGCHTVTKIIERKVVKLNLIPLEP